MKKGTPKVISEGRSEIDRMKEAMDAFRTLPPEWAVSAMPVIVPYIAIVGRVEHYKRGEEHCFRITRTVKAQSPDQRWDETPLNAHAMREEFLNVKDWSGAYDFLTTTGMFSPLDDRITWSEFQRWQDFARLVLEHGRLVSAMQEGNWSGEQGEALCALTGLYPSAFFDIAGGPVPPSTTFPQEVEWLEREKRLRLGLAPAIQEGERFMERKRRELWTWFRQPPGEFCSIEWLPKRKEDADAVLPKLRMGGAMIEFLLPREALRPAFVIHPWTTLQAIAATIFADYSSGVEYRTCEFCNRLFPVGNQKTKRFCNQTKCKNAAHSRKVREKARKQRKHSEAKKHKAAQAHRNGPTARETRNLRKGR